MIIVRSPLRITLGGGGTDLPSYYEKYGGFAIGAAIDRYVYINLHRTFQPGFIIKYSSMEKVQRIDQIKHPIIRESLKLLKIDDNYLEIASMADVAAGTGLDHREVLPRLCLKPYTPISVILSILKNWPDKPVILRSIN